MQSSDIKANIVVANIVLFSIYLLHFSTSCYAASAIMVYIFYIRKQIGGASLVDATTYIGVLASAP